MQINFRYSTNHIKRYVLSIIILAIFNLQGLVSRNPFCYSDLKSNIPFSYRAIAQVHNSSTSFAILSCQKNETIQNIIAKKGDVIFGYKIVDIFGDMLTVQDDKNNEIILYLK